MKSKIIFVFIILLILCSVSPKIGQGYTLSTTQRNFERFEFDNGLILIVEEDHRLPVVSVQIWHRAGSAQEQEYLGAGQVLLDGFAGEVLFFQVINKKFYIS